MTRTEDQIQRAMVDWLNLCIPPPPLGPYWTACNPLPNKGKAQAGVSKAMGLKAGTPDLIMCWQGKFIGIEVKAPGRYLSGAQSQTHMSISWAGGLVHIVHSVDELQAFLLVLGVPVRGRIAA